MINGKGEQLGILDIDQAVEMAADVGLDLVEVSPNAEPPVCRVMDFGKYQYEQNNQKTCRRVNKKRG